MVLFDLIDRDMILVVTFYNETISNQHGDKN